ncbi:GNAT family N-acetyltransferase [Prolixibacter denitrificans]|uniref:Acetyltransferase n=1 Tax=Prolixibacter denitrificans TaxID=1541063 RepID=A0A2P8CK58_9BACT|nr:GNAT family protein [Prolixibacter denitrificans]PSK85357.1 diamine N-acetyltransferase [Prolixibacter denitrificans]GET19976.1 acetyltransferase [Prolixibacter denitrificans]
MTQYLKSDKITLRAIEPEDIELLYRWENNSEVWEVSDTLAPFSKYLIALYIKNSDKDIYESKQLRLMIESAEGRAVGSIDLFDFEPHHSRAGIGILIAEKEDRQNGYASEALKLVLEYCFSRLNLHAVYANIDANNEASIGLFKKFGFELAGTRKDWIRDARGWKDEHLFQLINPED